MIASLAGFRAEEGFGLTGLLAARLVSALRSRPVGLTLSLAALRRETLGCAQARGFWKKSEVPPLSYEKSLIFRSKSGVPSIY